MSAVETFRAVPASRPGLLSRMSATLFHWVEIRETRNQLSRLTDRELSDIGLCRGDIERVSRGQ